MNVVETLVERLFATKKERRSALAILNRYGKQPHHREPERVRVALLKLAEGSVSRLQIQARIADMDYRDVLASAEYPQSSQSSLTPGNDPQKYQQLIRSDRLQYEAWLQQVLGPEASG